MPQTTKNHARPQSSAYRSSTAMRASNSYSAAPQARHRKDGFVDPIRGRQTLERMVANTRVAADLRGAVHQPKRCKG